MGWAVRGSARTPVEVTGFSLLHIPRSLLYDKRQPSSPGVKWPERDVYQPSHPLARLRMVKGI